MTLFRRVAWTSAAVLLLGWATTAFAPPFGRPPPRPPAGGFSGRPGGISGGFSGSRPGSISGIRPGNITGGRPTTFTGGSFSGSRPGTVTGGSFSGTRPGTATGGFWGNTGRSYTGGSYTGNYTGRPPRTAPQVRAEMSRLITSKPESVFSRLRGEDGRILGEAARITVAREAVEKVAQRAETSRKPVESLVEVRSARREAGTLPHDVRDGLDRVAQGLERRILGEGLQEVGLQVERGQWAEVATRSTASLGELSDFRLSQDQNLGSAEFRVERVKVQEVLIEARGLAEQMQALKALETTLEGLGKASAEQAARALRQVDRARLSGELQRHAEGLRGLAELRAEVGRKWVRPPDVAELKASVGRLERALVDVPGAEGNLGKKLLQELAVKAVLEGHAAEALKLLPEGGPAEHAASLLRDLKALALGEGKVETAPAQLALGEPGKGPGSPRAPPGLEPLIPEGAREGWRPPVKESAKADLPPLKQAEKVGAEVKARAEKAVPAQRANLEKRAAQTRQKITTVYNRVMAPERAERRQLAAVESELDRRLRAEERVKARLLLGQGRPVGQVVATLKAQPSSDEEDEFLADVEKRLGRTLSGEQRTQAKRLRKQGRTAAEVADILRS